MLKPQQATSLMRTVIDGAEHFGQKSTTAPRYCLRSAADLCNAPPLRSLIRGVLPANSFAAMFGPSRCGKTFLALDMSVAIAEGAPTWFGRRVTAAPVVYVALEGEAGLRKRVMAWAEHNHRQLPERLNFITQPLDLRQDDDIADLAIAIVESGGRDGLLVIDTLNRAARGADENSSRDMGELIVACEEVRRRTGWTVLLIAHTGKDSAKGLRGHSSLFAALDAAIEVTHTDGGREWSVAKSKDDEDGERFPFTLRVVDLGDDEEGEPVTSCIVVPDRGAVPVKRVKLPQGGNQRIAMDTLAAPLRESRDFGKGDAPPTCPCIDLEAAVATVAAHLTCEAKRRNERAREAITALVARGVYGSKEGWLWRT
ncbi:AAA family ATPase [Paraburkholderia bannensis]|uniref:AAA family ATPase n=1 Tax=Paraburkholderia bannensis TaxID=765414 RepID=UPI002AB10878|nr:AAA family ATPase [Paraburkholderia bannensis]